MQSLGVVGGGVLGRAVARGFMESCDVRVFDLVKERRTHEMAEVATADVVMFCLPTPALADGRCDTTHLEAALLACEREGWWTPQSCYCVRSTVPIGFTQGEAAKREFRLPLLHSPEFLTARCAAVDFQTPARNIIGSPRIPPEIEDAADDVFESNDDAWKQLMVLYKRRFPGVHVLLMPSDASELVKLACNSFFASKVTLFNMFAEIAKARGVDWDEVRGGILSDGRIAHAHTNVPGPDGKSVGYGGQCLPKDLSDLFHCCREAGVDAELLRAVHERNVRTRGDDPGLAKIELPEENTVGEYPCGCSIPDFVGRKGEPLRWRCLKCGGRPSADNTVSVEYVR